jgi:hypothetical protein
MDRAAVVVVARLAMKLQTMLAMGATVLSPQVVVVAVVAFPG